MTLEPYHHDDTCTLYHGDALAVLAALPDASVHAVVTDPPYGLEFMGKDWDAPWKAAGAVLRSATERGGFQDGNGGNPYSRSRVEYGRGGSASQGFQAWCTVWAAECLRVLKPGGHLLAFGGTRTWHRLACAVEDAGFEVRDSIAWLYGSGFPKSRNLDGDWKGWGTALKPSFEPVVVARKPFRGSVARNVLTHGTGALNVDGCRTAMSAGDREQARVPQPALPREHYTVGGSAGRNGARFEPPEGGRWPANAALDPAAAAALDAQTPEATSRSASMLLPRTPGFAGTTYGDGGNTETATVRGHDDTGRGSRYFPVFRYEAKASAAERPRIAAPAGADNATGYGRMKTRECNRCGSRSNPAGGAHSGKPWPACGHDDWSWVEQQSASEKYISHPTVKPLALMRWLVRLVTPPGGIVLDPFTGSGTTVEACRLEGFRCWAVEQEAEYLPLIVSRLTKPLTPALDLGPLDAPVTVPAAAPGWQGDLLGDLA